MRGQAGRPAAETDAQLERPLRIEREIESGALSSPIGLPVHFDWFVVVHLRLQLLAVAHRYLCVDQKPAAYPQRANAKRLSHNDL